MSRYVKLSSSEARRPRREINAANAGSQEVPLARWFLITVALLFAVAFLLMPLLNVFAQALVGGWKFYVDSLLDPDTRADVCGGGDQRAAQLHFWSGRGLGNRQVSVQRKDVAHGAH